MALIYGKKDQVQFNVEQIGGTVAISGDIAIVNSVTKKMISTYCSGYNQAQNELRQQLNGLMINTYDSNAEQGVKAGIILKLIDSLCIVVRDQVNRDPSSGRILTTRMLNIDVVRNELGGALSNEALLMMQKQTKLYGTQIIMVSTMAHESTKRLAMKRTQTRAIAPPANNYYRQEPQRQPYRGGGGGGYDYGENPALTLMVVLCLLCCCLFLFIPLCPLITCCLFCLAILNADD